MDTKEINSILKGISIFGGTFPRDAIPQTEKRPIAFVVNTDDRKSAGEHWLGIFLLTDGRGEYFDPFGFPPLHQQLNTFLSVNCTNGFIYNSTTLQHPGSSSCGLFVVDYIRSRYKSDTFEQFLNHFSTDLEENEYILRTRLQKWSK